jgi:hypothetical protein
LFAREFTGLCDLDCFICLVHSSFSGDVGKEGSGYAMHAESGLNKLLAIDPAHVAKPIGPKTDSLGQLIRDLLYSRGA